MTTNLNNTFAHNAVIAPLQEKDIRIHLEKLNVENIGMLHIFPSIDSTNEYLLENNFTSDHVLVCLAEKQTQGRGRYGHEWISPAGVNLYLSMLWPVKHIQKSYEVLSLWLLLAMVELLEEHQISGIQLKWPNDICVHDKKLAGILIERKVGKGKNNLVIGLGLNVSMSLLESVQINAPWIDLLSIKPDFQISRNEISAKVLSFFCETLTKFEKNHLIGLSEKWNEYDMLVNKKVEFLFNGEANSGTAKGIDDLGQIIIENSGQLMYLNSSHVNKVKLTGN